MSFDATITYLTNSGFILCHGGDALVFDDEGQCPQLVTRLLAGKKRITFFASHGHGDHYSEAIFSYPVNARYVLSSDIARVGKDITALSPGQSAAVNGMDITAHGSTDLGVSFLVNLNGARIFHAGDFNLWHWIDESTADEIRTATDEFYAVLDTLRPPIDIAFFPVDPRQGTRYDEGARKFVARLSPRLFIPMHFRDSAGAAEGFAAMYPSGGTRVCPITRTGESVTLSV